MDQQSIIIGRRSLLFAGAAAGMAFQFKITFVAASAAGAPGEP